MKKIKKFFMLLVVSIVVITAAVTSIVVLDKKGNQNNNLPNINNESEFDAEKLGVYFASAEEAAAARSASEDLKGGSIIVGSGTKVEINGGNINYHEAEYGGAFYVQAGGVLEINGGRIAYNGAKYGGAIYIEYGGKVILNGGIIEKNTAESGYAICVEPNPDGTSSDFENLQSALIIGNTETYEQILVGNSFAEYSNFKIDYYVNGIYNSTFYKKSKTFWSYDIPLSYEECNGYFLDNECIFTVDDGDVLNVVDNEIKLYTMAATVNSFNFTTQNSTVQVSPNINNQVNTMVLPAEYNGLPVTTTSGFSSLDKDFELYISKNVKSLQGFDSSNITHINFTDAVTEIQNNAFANCEKLTGELVLRESVTKIGQSCFKNCQFTKIVLNTNTSIIEQNAFNGCNKINADLIIPNTVTLIEKGAFENAAASGALVIPGSVERISNWAFYNTGFTSLTLGEGLKYLDTWAFGNNLKMTGPLNIPNSMVSIGEKAFEYSTFTSLNLGTGVQNIAQRAFNECRSLKGDLVIPNSVTNLGEYAFYGSSRIDGKIVISANMLAVYPNTFAFCKATSLTFSSGSKITAIGTAAFYYCSSLTGTLELPSGVTAIRSYAFYNCSSITGLKFLGNSVNTIESSAFSYCSSMIGSLVLPASLTEIGSCAFQSTKFTSLTLNSGLKTIKDNAFSSCSTLTGSLTIPSSLTSIEKNAFNKCSFTSVSFTSVFGKVWATTPDNALTCGKIMETSYTSPNATNLTHDYSHYYWKLGIRSVFDNHTSFDEHVTYSLDYDPNSPTITLKGYQTQTCACTAIVKSQLDSSKYIIIDNIMTAQTILDSTNLNNKIVFFAPGEYGTLFIRPTHWQVDSINVYDPNNPTVLYDEITLDQVDMTDAVVGYHYTRAINNVVFVGSDGAYFDTFIIESTDVGNDFITEKSRLGLSVDREDMVRGLTISQNSYDGSRIHNSYYAHIPIDGLTFQGMDFRGKLGRIHIYEGLYDDVQKNIVIEDCTFVTDTPFRSGNSILDWDAAGIMFSAKNTGFFENVQVRNNVVDGHYLGIYVSNVRDVAIEGNQVSNTVHNAIAIQNAFPSVQSAYVTGIITVKGNTISNTGVGVAAGERAVRFGVCKDATITVSGNTFTNCVEDRTGKSPSQGYQLLATEALTNCTFSFSNNKYADNGVLTAKKVNTQYFVYLGTVPS